MADEKKQSEAPAPKSLPGGVTQAQVDAWKQEHGKVYMISIPGDEPDKTYACYLKQPSRRVIAASMSHVQKDPLKSNEILLQNCWLGGDMEIQQKDDLFLSAAAKLGDLFNIKEAEIKEL